MAESGHQQSRQTGTNKSCTCTPSITISHVTKWNFQLFLDRKITHATNCSRHTDTTTWSLGLRALSPRIQVMFGLQLGGWSLSMVGKITPHYIVDPLQSPAFTVMWEAKRNLERFPIAKGGGNADRSARVEKTTAACNGLTAIVYKCAPLDLPYQKHIESICATLRSKLLQAFALGRASPADRTPEGDTVLSEFVHFASNLNGYQETLFDLLSSIVEILTPNDTDSISYL
jgi:hypothetical protein